MDTEAVIARLALEPHPEGGHYRRVWQHEDTDGSGRPLASAIAYLLPAGVVSRWHRVDAMELWEHEAGDPLELRVSRDGVHQEAHLLGPGSGAEKRVVVPAHAWQSARSAGAGSLVTCTVTPGFVWEGFELAPEGWEPGAGWRRPGGAAPSGV